VRVLLTVGRKFDRSDLGPIPRRVHVESWVDQARVFEAADLVVCHGGSGTAFGALAAGLPLVVVPVFADQFENGRRVARRGAGLTLELEQEHRDGPRRVVADGDAPGIADAIDEVLRSPSYRRHAREVAAEMAAVPTVDQVLEMLT
jgi:UDP:flavonoid glycosyltransferase YjiC (YdhE family)